MQVQGNFKMQAHITSGVVMDIAAFKGSHSVGNDRDAAALRAARARPKSIGAMDEEGSKMRTLTYCDAKITSMRTAAGQFKGAMIELLEKVQKASAHPLLSKTHEHTRAQQPVSSRGRWMKVECWRDNSHPLPLP